MKMLAKLSYYSPAASDSLGCEKLLQQPTDTPSREKATLPQIFHSCPYKTVELNSVAASLLFPSPVHSISNVQ